MHHYQKRIHRNLVTYYDEDTSRCWDCDQESGVSPTMGEDIRITQIRCPDTGELRGSRPMCRHHREEFHAGGYVVYTVLDTQPRKEKT